jgi:hypothetical protein
MSFFKNLFKEVFASLPDIMRAIPICAIFELDIAVRVSTVFKNVLLTSMPGISPLRRMSLPSSTTLPLRLRSAPTRS